MREGTTLRRGRLNQGTVIANRGAVPELAARRRFGPNRGFEGRIEKILGTECLEQVLRTSYGVRWPTKIMGIPAYVRDGCLVPQMSGGGFTSLSDLISEATSGGKRQVFRVNKTGVAAPAAGSSQHLWGQATMPPTGTAAAAAPGGTAFDRTSTGALGQANPSGGDTLHFVSAQPVSTVAGALLMYDYLWGVDINEATTANTVTGVPTRYATTTAPGNWLSNRITTILGATAHNVTVTYTDDAGNATQNGGAQAIRVSSAVQTISFTAPKWTYDMAAGDYGMRAVTSIALSAASTGHTEWMLGHSIVTMPMPISNVVVPVDGINSAFNLVQIIDSAALAFLEFWKTATTAATVQIEDLILVAG